MIVKNKEGIYRVTFHSMEEMWGVKDVNMEHFLPSYR